MNRWHRVAFLLLVLGGAWGQGSPEARYGVPLGTRVELGVPLSSSQQALVVVFPVPARFCLARRLGHEPPETCFGHALLARAWARDYPGVSVVVADPRSSEADVRTLVRRLGGLSPARLAVGGRARELAGELAVNRSPFAFLVDRAGKVRDKLGGFGLRRWLAFEAQVAAASEGAWDRVAAASAGELVPGASVPRWLPAMIRGQRYTLVVNLFPGCWPCDELARDLIREAPRLLDERPALALNVMVLDESGEAACRAVRIWNRRFGRQAPIAEGPVCGSRSGGDPLAKLFGKALPRHPRLRIVRYRMMDENDLGRWWWVFTAPAAALLEGDRVLHDPYRNPLLPRRWRVGTRPDFSAFWHKVRELTGPVPR